MRIPDYEKEERWPNENSTAFLAARECAKQRERVRFLKHEREDAAGMLEELRCLPPDWKAATQALYDEMVAEAEHEYRCRRTILLEMGYDEYA